jgi:UDP-N-acetylmuramyl pentapeptide phosphotransferase/UDP-N-acetylglucosamine-1-phosphate transferase
LRRTRNQSLFVALLFLGVVAALATFRPPEAASPFLRVVTKEGVQFSVLVRPQQTLAACRYSLSALTKAVCEASPGCLIKEEVCLVSLSAELRRIGSDLPLQKPSLRFAGGNLVFEAPESEELLSACMLLQKQGIGECFAQGQSRPFNEMSGPSTGGGLAFIPGPAWTEIRQMLIAGFAASFLLAVLTVLTSRWHGRYTFDRAHGVQKFHETPVPRIGGIAIFSGLLLGLFLLSRLGFTPYTHLLSYSLAAASIAFLFGLLEDISGKVGVTTRLIATMASAVMAWWLVGESLRSLEIPLLDQWLSVTFISVALTAFAVAGLANSINIIDGFHGLASGTVFIMLGVFAGLAHAVGDPKLMLFCLLVMSATLGFMLVNAPFGKIFLGDGGAYLLGFLLGWIALLLPARNPNVSPWACLLVCAYPVTETVFSIYRRLKSGLGIGDPDRAHLHSLVKIAVMNKQFGHWPAWLRNFMVSPLMWCLAFVPGAFAFIFYSNQAVLIVCLIAFAIAYWLIYRVLSAMSA